MNVIHRTTLRYLESVNTPDYPEPTWKWGPDMSQVAGVSPLYWKWDAVNERPIPMTAGEQATVNANLLSTQRAAAAATLTQTENILRAVVLLILDELNAHSAKVNAILTAIDSNSTLANLKTAILAVADLPIRTEAQLRAAIAAKLGS